MIYLIPALRKNILIREERYGACLINKETWHYVHIPSFEAFLLSLFDGTRTIDDIARLLKHLKNSPGIDEIKNDVLSLIEGRNEYVEMIGTPLKAGRASVDPDVFLRKRDDTRGKTRLKSPISVDLYLTRRCNLKCNYCFANAKYAGDANAANKNDEMDISTINQLIDQMAELEVKRVLITGGEATLRPDLPEIIKRITGYGINIFLATNAYSISDKLAKKLYDAGLREIQAKLDSPVGMVQDRLSGIEGSGERLIKGIKILKKYPFNLSVASVVTSLNVEEIPGVIRTCAELGVDEVSPRIYASGLSAMHGRGGEYLNPSPGSIRWLEDRMKELQDQYKGIIKIKPLDSSLFMKKKESEVPFCSGLVSSCTVFENGSVLPCELLYDGSDGYIIGNVKTASLYDIWHSERSKRWTGRKGLTGEFCPSCGEYDRCKGGCPVKSIVAYGKWLVDPFCIRAPPPTNIRFFEPSKSIR